MECKVDFMSSVSLTSFRINRNIVECKVESRRASYDSLNRINRNIVECKVNHCVNYFLHISVLIETSWNVKVHLYHIDFGVVRY